MASLFDLICAGYWRGLSEMGDLFKKLTVLSGNLLKTRGLFEGVLNRIITVFVLQVHLVNVYLVIQNCL